MLECDKACIRVFKSLQDIQPQQAFIFFSRADISVGAGEYNVIP